MSQDFRQRYEQLRASDPTKPSSEADSTGNESFYETPGHSRNLCLIWPEGRRMFLNYAYLVSGELTVESEINIINLHFSLHTVTVKGYVLETLFMALLDQLPRILVEADPRYIGADKQNPTISQLVVVENES